MPDFNPTLRARKSPILVDQNKVVSYGESNEFVKYDKLKNKEVNRLKEILESIRDIQASLAASGLSDQDAAKVVEDLRRALEPLSKETERTVVVEIGKMLDAIAKAKAPASPEERPTDVPLPDRAPALWAEAKQLGDTPPGFIQRHYAPWLGKGLTRADVRRLDPKLYMALANWLRDNELPDGFDLPTLKEQNDRWIDRLRLESPLTEQQSPEPLQNLKDAQRLLSAVQRRRNITRP